MLLRAIDQKAFAKVLPYGTARNHPLSTLGKIALAKFAQTPRSEPDAAIDASLSGWSNRFAGTARKHHVTLNCWRDEIRWHYAMWRSRGLSKSSVLNAFRSHDV
eukprot:7166275-Karenia_brevis.AAC.1